MAAHVVSAAAPFKVFVVCDDAEVANWAKRLGAEPIMCPEAGLNPAVAQGVEHLRHRGFRRVIIAHGDLPFAAGFAQFADGQSADDGAEASVGIAPDRWGKGTNVLSVPADCDFRFSYGPGSFHHHAREAERLGLAVRIHRDDSLAWDIDLPCDLNPEAMLLLSPAGDAPQVHPLRTVYNTDNDEGAAGRPSAPCEVASTEFRQRCTSDSR